MATEINLSELATRASEIRTATAAGSITPEMVGSLLEDLLTAVRNGDATATKTASGYTFTLSHPDGTSEDVTIDLSDYAKTEDLDKYAKSNYLLTRNVIAPKAGGTYSLSDYFDTDAASLSYSASGDYLTVSGNSLTISENDGGSDRIGSVTVTATFEDDTTASATITVLQTDKDEKNYLRVPKTLAISLGQPQLYDLNYFINTDAVELFFDVKEISGRGWAAIAGETGIFSVSDADSKTARAATVTIYATFSDGSTKTATMTMFQPAAGGVI